MAIKRTNNNSGKTFRNNSESWKADSSTNNFVVDGLMKKVIVVFANSIKNHNHCVAGKDISTGKWIRPVSNVAGAELSNEQCKVSNSGCNFLYPAKPLQKIEIEFSAYAPLIHQPENFIITNTQWIQRYKIDNVEINNFLDAPETLWGFGNKVNYSEITTGAFKIEQSLYLVKVQNVTFHVTADAKRRVLFDYNNNRYNLPVTDPQFNKLLSGEVQHNDILCVSLAGNYEGSCYKIVATIL